MKYFCVLICSLILFGSVSAQSSSEKKFNRRYVDVAVTLVATDVKEAHRVTDSLVNVARSDEQKIKSLMLLAKLYENEGDMKNGLIKAMKADTIANATMNYSWQAVISGSLATSFRRLGLLKVSEGYLKKAELANAKQPEANMKLLTKINILHERVFHCFERKQILDARNYVIEASKLIHIDGNEDKKSILIKATNAQLRGICELQLGNFALAESFLKSALNKIQATESNLIPYIFQALAEVEIGKKNYNGAREYLNKVEPYLESGRVEELRMKTDETWSRYYAEVRDREMSLKFKAKSIAIREKRDIIANGISDDLITQFQAGKKFYRSQLTFALGGIILISIGATGCIMFFYRQKKIYKTHYDLQKNGHFDKNLIPNSEEVIMNDSTIIDQLNNSSVIKAKDSNMSKETEEKLYEKFVKQEESLFYLEKNITLSHLASAIGTNQKYASIIIQKFRGKEFYAYIQSRRIAYIIQEIRKSPELLGYKLSYLAEMCGFTTLSAFSTAFKDETGMPPSAFVHFVRKEKGNK
jgi:AraC-like DNA-binding protein/Tfp pilus assembly protein PilF